MELENNPVLLLAQNCVALPNINRLMTEVEFPVRQTTVIKIKCDDPWFVISGDEEITCVRERTFNYVEKPSCTSGSLVVMKN